MSMVFVYSFFVMVFMSSAKFLFVLASGTRHTASTARTVLCTNCLVRCSSVPMASRCAFRLMVFARGSHKGSKKATTCNRERTMYAKAVECGTTPRQPRAILLQIGAARLQSVERVQLGRRYALT